MQKSHALRRAALLSITSLMNQQDTADVLYLPLGKLLMVLHDLLTS